MQGRGPDVRVDVNAAPTRAGSASAATLPAALRLGPAHLTVPHVDRSVGWYERALGLRVHRRDADRAELGSGRDEPVLVLHEDPVARPPGRHAGLYHYALLYPSREDLARAALRLGETRTPIQGASDHGTHEAIYLADVDGNGIELAADRPRERWPRGLGYQHGPAPLDLASLLAAAPVAEPGPTVDDGLRVGHLHLHVGDIDQGLAFYGDVLGFEAQANLASAAFVSAGGYHHHVGFNVWRGRGVGPPPAHTIGLRQWTVVLPSEGDVAAVRARMRAAGLPAEPVAGGFLARDPWENAVAFLADPAPAPVR
ncbi:MAG: VOC family protein [Thermoleophilia bacterium]|nr:VOC family protein [Thermoleophilia bacterium]